MSGAPRTSIRAQRDRVAELERELAVAREEAEVARVLLSLSGELAEVRSVEDTLARTVNIVPGMFGAQRGVAAVWDPAAGRFSIEGHVGFDDAGAELLRRLAARAGGLPLLRGCLLSRKPALVEDAAHDERVSEHDAARRGLGAYVGIPLSRWVQEFGALGLEFDAPRRFGRREEALARGVAREVGIALANARRFNLLQDLRRLGIQVGSRLRLGAVVTEITSAAAALLGAPGAVLLFADASSRTLFPAGGAGAAGEWAGEVGRVDLAAEPWRALLRGDRVQLGSESLPGATSGVAVPVPGAELLLGALVVTFDRPLRLEPDEEEALSVLAAQCGTAIENAQRYERQRSVAHSLQQGLLAMEDVDLDAWAIGAVYEPAADEAEVGGDFFDAFELPDSRIALVVGDVAGKGAEAAAGTAMAKYMLRAFAMRNPAPASVLFHLNNALTKGFDADRFTTLLYAAFDPGTNRCQLALGGHPPPLVYRGAGEVESVVSEGVILGAFDDQQYEQTTLELGSGDLLVAYTDGLIEARSDDDLYGRSRVVRSLRRHAPAIGAPEELARRLYQDAQTFGHISDDTVVFVLAPKRPG